MKKKSDNSNNKNIDELDDDDDRLLYEMRAMNSEFSILLHKVDNIEESQGQLHTKITTIYDAIYDPSDGIFSKLASTKSELENKITELTVHGAYVRNDIAKEEEFSDELHDQLKTINSTIKGIEHWKHTVTVFARWISVTIGAGIITYVIKFIYDNFIAK